MAIFVFKIQKKNLVIYGSQKFVSILLPSVIYENPANKKATIKNMKKKTKLKFYLEGLDFLYNVKSCNYSLRF